MYHLEHHRNASNSTSELKLVFNDKYWSNEKHNLNWHPCSINTNKTTSLLKSNNIDNNTVDMEHLLWHTHGSMLWHYHSVDCE